MNLDFITPGWRVSKAAPVVLLVGATLAQVPGSQAPRSDGRKPRPSVQQQEGVQGSATTGQAEADRKFREMDRQLSRTMRSICSRC